MLHTKRSLRGAVTAPHHLAARAGLAVLEDGGNAIEAMIAAAAAITVVYPHMNAIGGDNFWLIHEPGKPPRGIDACGAAAELADRNLYKDYQTIPTRGPLAALTVAGAVSGWQRAFEISRTELSGRLPLPRLLEHAIHHAEKGTAVTRSQHDNTAEKRGQMDGVPGFAETYLAGSAGGETPQIGARFGQPRLAATLRRLGEAGFDDFYRGDLARAIAGDLETAGTPLRLADLKRHRALDVEPLALDVAGHRVFNMPPPTQGLASLMLLGIFERLKVAEAETFDYVHSLVEASKQAFLIRDKHVVDPAYMTADPAEYLTAATLDRLAGKIDRAKALPWPQPAQPGDTVWLGAIDGEGRAVSFIQSLYWEFGSGVVLDKTGITWQNRGVSFSLDPNHHNALMPRRRPFHTIQPALARLADGRVMVYGTMGGEGQPQTQAMLFSRHVMYGQALQAAVTAPRWLLGRTWGDETASLRIESRFDSGLIERLQKAGHDMVVTGPFDEIMGHAGALIGHKNGLIEGAADPRSDGLVAAF
jgi:gamma-glutamyltranspeptidase/glutathione hydrolase